MLQFFALSCFFFHVNVFSFFLVTSRPIRPGEEDGKNYHFAPRSEVEADISGHKFLEYGEYDGHIYGTKLDSIRSVIRSGRMCILDCSPAAVKLLHNSPEFRPFVCFLASPGVEQLRFMNEYGRVMSGQSQRSLTVGVIFRDIRTHFNIPSVLLTTNMKMHN